MWKKRNKTRDWVQKKYEMKKSSMRSWPEPIQNINKPIGFLFQKKTSKTNQRKSILHFIQTFESCKISMKYFFVSLMCQRIMKLHLLFWSKKFHEKENRRTCASHWYKRILAWLFVFRYFIRITWFTRGVRSQIYFCVRVTYFLLKLSKAYPLDWLIIIEL